MPGVLVGEDGVGGVEMPVDAERAVEYRDAAVGLGMVELIALVLEYGDVGEHGESVGETARDEELQMVVLGQLDGHMPAVGRRAFADVDGDVEDGTLDAAHEFGLCEGRTLEMQPAHNALGRA